MRVCRLDILISVAWIGRDKGIAHTLRLPLHLVVTYGLPLYRHDVAEYYALMRAYLYSRLVILLPFVFNGEVENQY